ncbi:hypothetical protein [Pseudomonas entomophila]|uniref:hypothetical protein n=1 Tax=Pseudomonas entomophila TaxID=312306 RepID=UPI001F001CEB|nr:hypothetical protein [Pseudomonas entomophila]MCG8293617.1 hypothetical protein [Pseudomonas entomophila]
MPWAIGTASSWIVSRTDPPPPAWVLARRRVSEGSGFDRVLDLDALLKDPLDPDCLQARHDSGDHLYPGLEGSQGIAQWLLQLKQIAIY